jgi:hypothetical protein
VASAQALLRLPVLPRYCTYFYFYSCSFPFALS